MVVAALPSPQPPHPPGTGDLVSSITQHQSWGSIATTIRWAGSTYNEDIHEVMTVSVCEYLECFLFYSASDRSSVNNVTTQYALGQREDINNKQMRIHLNVIEECLYPYYIYSIFWNIFFLHIRRQIVSLTPAHSP